MPTQDAAALSHLIPNRVAIFCDFDGTLVDLAQTPDSVSPPDGMADELVHLATALDGALAIITGRRIADIDRYLAPTSLPVAGSHGAERRRADGSIDEVDQALIETAAEMARVLAPLALQHRALLVEAKPAAVALHYRRAPELAELCINAMTRLAAEHPEFMVMKGKMVVEARPRRFSKGEAVRAFMGEAPFAGRLPIFVGDDVTDEDGFLAAQALGGVGIKLGRGESVAKLRIADVPSVHKLLTDIAGLPHVSAGSEAAS